MNNHLEILKKYRQWREIGDEDYPDGIVEALDWAIHELQAATESQGVEPVARVWSVSTGRTGSPKVVQIKALETNATLCVGDNLYTHPKPTGGGVPENYPCRSNKANK